MSLVRNVSITVAGYYVSTGAAALSALVVASALGARGAGVFALARVVPGSAYDLIHKTLEEVTKASGTGKAIFGIVQMTRSVRPARSCLYRRRAGHRPARSPRIFPP